MRIFHLISPVFLLLALSGPAFAALSLYEAEVEVLDQTRAVRLKAMRQALEEVLVRVSGYSLVVTEPAVTAVLGNAGRYVQQYHYRPLERQGEAVAAAEEGGEQAQFQLWLRFDPAAIKQLLQGAGLAVWGGERPRTLIWLAIEEGGKRQLVAANDDGAAREVLEQAARRRALPMLLPLLDLTDRKAVRVGDVWGEFHDSVKDASARYQPGALLIGRLHPASGGNWRARWTLYQGDETFRWERKGADVQAVLASGIEGAADNLSLLYAERYESGAASARLRFEGVTSFSEFQRLLDYLGKLNGVAAIQVLTIEDDVVELQLASEGGMDLILKTLEHQGVVAPVEGYAEPPESEEQLPSSGDGRVQPVNQVAQPVPVLPNELLNLRVFRLVK